MAEIRNNFACHHPQSDFCVNNNLDQTLVFLLFYLALFLILLLLPKLLLLFSKSTLFMNPAITDLSTNPSLFILLATISLVNLL